MAVDTEHPLYRQFAGAWQKVRDCIKGPTAVKNRGEEYLPRFYKQSDHDYNAYRKRAVFFNAVKRTLQAFVGFIYAKNPDWKLPANAATEAYQKDATLTGVSLYDYSKDVVRDAVSIGRAGSLVDWAPEPEDRVFVIKYEAEDVINWGYKRFNGRTLLSFVVLREMSTEPDPGEPLSADHDPYEHVEHEQWRVYRLRQDAPGAPTWVEAMVLRRRMPAAGKKRGVGESGPAPKPPTGSARKDSLDFRIVDQKIPHRRLVSLHRIPFVFHNAAGGDANPGEVPMEDLAEVNLAHYRASANLENARSAAGCPTPYIFGISKKEVEGGAIHLGTTEAIVSTEKNVTAGFLTYGGEGVLTLENSLKEKEANLAALGAEMLESQSSGKSAEAFETVQIRESGRVSALISIAIACSQTLSDVLQWMAWWQKTETAEDPENLDGRVGVEFSTDFLLMAMSSDMLGKLMEAYLQNALSYDELFWNLQRGGIIRSEKSIDQEKADLKKSAAMLPGDPGDGTGDEPPRPARKTRRTGAAKTAGAAE